jgi:hypothetical protein
MILDLLLVLQLPDLNTLTFERGYLSFTTLWSIFFTKKTNQKAWRRADQ